GQSITDSFNYTVKDPGGLTDTAVLTITINSVEHPPVANNDAGLAPETGGTLNGTAGSNATGNVILGDANGGGAANDVDHQTASLPVSALRTGAVEGSGTAGTLGTGLVGAHGTLTINSDGSYSYLDINSFPTRRSSDLGQSITDSFNYTVKDPGGLTDTAVL